MTHMASIHEKLKVTVSKASDGKTDYLQILSADQFSLNIVLIAGKIEINDQRKIEPAGGKA